MTQSKSVVGIPYIDSQTESESVLGFNPISEDIKAFEIEVTPEIAAYILEKHNEDNRKIVKSQVNKIVKSIREDGWLKDGQPMTFNTEGNLAEAQHRLKAIVETGITAKMVVVTGVITACFTKCAPAKPRKAEDEIQRKDKTATQSEASILRQLLIRRQGDTLTIQNAIEKWINWRFYVRAGVNLIDEFFDKVEDYNPWRRTFGAWAALMVSIGEEESASVFLSLLQEEVLGDGSPCCLTREFRQFFRDESTYMSNAGRTEFIYQMLCVVADRIQKDPTGEIQLGLKKDQFCHSYLMKKGIYRKFLENPQNLQISNPPF